MRCGHLCSLSLIAIFVGGFAWPLAAQDAYAPVYKPSLHVQKAAGEISVDGWLNDAGWQGAGVADHFVESNPGNQIKPPVETRAMMTYNDEYLYVGIIAQANPAEIRASLCERDLTPGDDNLGVFIDTYGDATMAYEFFVNAYGVQYDAIWSSSAGDDNKYDLVWESAGKITDSGFQVEIAIPFASLRFPNQPQQQWRVEFFRYHEREVTREISWTAYDRDEACWPCQWGTVTGIENVSPGKGIEIIPALVGHQSGHSNTISRAAAGLTDSLDWINKDPEGELSVSTKYSIGSNSTAEFAFNPDFSQVEADADQIDVNSPTALSFPEKRPFFQEGRDLFQTPFTVVYTRSINDPSVAGKFTLRKGGTSIGYLGAYDEHSPIIIPFEDFSSPDLPGGRSASNIVSLRQSWGENSKVGFLMTDRRFDQGSGAGTVLSLDGSLRFAKSFRFIAQTVATHTKEPNDTAFTAPPYLDLFDSNPATNLNDQLFDGKHTAGFDGESYWGHALAATLEYSGRNFSISQTSFTTSPTFRVDNGFEPRNNRKEASLTSAYVFRFDKGLVSAITPSVNMAKVWNSHGTTKDRYIYADLETTLRKAQIITHSQYMASAELYRGTQFDGIWNVHQCVSAVPSKIVSVGASIGYGDQIAYGWRSLGRQTSYGLWCDLNPLDRIQLENTYSHVRSVNQMSGKKLFDGFIARSRLSALFNRELSLRFVVQYNDFGKTWDFDPLITYQLNPFTLFYVGTTYDYQKEYGLFPGGSRYAGVGEESFDQNCLKSRQFFMKLQYLFQL